MKIYYVYGKPQTQPTTRKVSSLYHLDALVAKICNNEGYIFFSQESDKKERSLAKNKCKAGYYTQKLIIFNT